MELCSTNLHWKLKKIFFHRSGKVLGSETSRTLDFLLTGSGYNRRIRPQFGGEPIEVFQGPEHANNVVKNVRYEWLRNINKYLTSSENKWTKTWLERPLELQIMLSNSGIFYRLSKYIKKPYKPILINNTQL